VLALAPFLAFQLERQPMSLSNSSTRKEQARAELERLVAEYDGPIISDPPSVIIFELFAVLRQSGERIAIDGPCYSACTLS
jgi:hypothetical protein